MALGVGGRRRRNWNFMRDSVQNPLRGFIEKAFEHFGGRNWIKLRRSSSLISKQLPRIVRVKNGLKSKSICACPRDESSVAPPKFGSIFVRCSQKRNFDRVFGEEFSRQAVECLRARSTPLRSLPIYYHNATTRRKIYFADVERGSTFATSLKFLRHTKACAGTELGWGRWGQSALNVSNWITYCTQFSLTWKLSALKYDPSRAP